MGYKYSCDKCQYTTYTGFICNCDDKYRRTSIVAAVDYKETRMTRQDAIKKLKIVEPNSASSNVWMVDCLEKLGLIKFEEEKFTICGVPKELIFAELEKAGYRIVKLEKNTSVRLHSCSEINSMLPGRYFNGKLIEINQ